MAEDDFIKAVNKTGEQMISSFFRSEFFSILGEFPLELLSHSLHDSPEITANHITRNVLNFCRSC